MEVLKRPIITEKTALLNEKGVFGFIVDKKANKIQIKDAVERMYAVNVDSVRTAIMPKKPKFRYTKSGVVSGHKPSYKKAFVQLKEGEYIDLYENI